LHSAVLPHDASVLAGVNYAGKYKIVKNGKQDAGQQVLYNQPYAAARGEFVFHEFELFSAEPIFIFLCHSSCYFSLKINFFEYSAAAGSAAADPFAQQNRGGEDG
jgi:hypothetical protein